MILSYLKKTIRAIWYWLLRRPISKPEPVKATAVVDQYVVVDYKSQLINLRKSELAMFNALSRKDKRAMAARFKIMQKKGQIIFQQINGKTVAIRNKDYENRGKNPRQSRINKT
jgi:lipase chaperone LimK